MIEQKYLNVIYIKPEKIYSSFDYELISRVIVNMLTNAIKYSDPNGIIHISAIPFNGNIRISISDNGIGIPDDKLHMVFDKFTQIQPVSLGAARSTGLGLAFCKMAVEAHNGNIGVESIEGKGSTFFFTLPIKDVEENYSHSEESFKEAIIGLKKYSLTSKEKNILKPYIIELEKLEVYDFSKVNRIIEEIKIINNKSINIWLNGLKTAIDNVNEDLYKELIEM